MPRLILNNSTTQNSRLSTQLSTFQSQNIENKQQLIDAHLPQINQPRKIPPKPPQRKLIRHDPEGMQQQQLSFTAEFHEKKTFQMAAVQQTHKLALREVPKPPINFNQHLQQHLLHQPQSSSSVTHFPNSFHQQQHLIFGTQSFHARQQFFHGSNIPSMSIMRNQHGHVTNGNSYNINEDEGERSDPENHIYEMIDESEANGHQNKKHEDVTRQQHDGNDLFQNLLRTEMMNQLQLCSGSTLRGNNGFLSHLTHEKRMDIIQETALALATSAYVEK